MLEQFSRIEMQIGEKAFNKLQSSRVAIFGIGGVGGYVMEALVRSGIGELDIIDNDKVSISNLNRQIIATHSSIGQDKVEVGYDRCLDINPNIKLHKYNTFFNSDTSNLFDFKNYDYVVDAIDTVTGKIELVERCYYNDIPIISSMGAGNKMNPTMFEVEDIYKTSVCPLAKVMRYELKRRGIKRLKVVYSKEPPKQIMLAFDDKTKKRIPSSNAFVPSVVGLIIASEVVKDLIAQIE